MASRRLHDITRHAKCCGKCFYCNSGAPLQIGRCDARRTRHPIDIERNPAARHLAQCRCIASRRVEVEQPPDASRAQWGCDGTPDDTAVGPLFEYFQQLRQHVKPGDGQRDKIEQPRRIVAIDSAIVTDQLGQSPAPRAEDGDGVAPSYFDGAHRPAP
jgi:hypothetical protein